MKVSGYGNDVGYVSVSGYGSDVGARNAAASPGKFLWANLIRFGQN